ncbi:peptide chain release factor N(5)-glutamine methyltransferase [Actinomyces radicidentis]|uniref:peptide chain release factor N(5)-glutamine methyltransferase n=1 Tax=Actinomyces radicidentis TaxID=111015 RepID=UPI0026DF5BB3|nr:peptide chain release factor N(5)-glutamine methyltransferase [Actinomyces radicidentis]
MDRYQLRRLVHEAGALLARAGVASPDVDARVLAEHVMGRSLVMVDGASPEQVERYRALVERRAAREPLQLLTGIMWFRGLELQARPGVFIVRPETEVVAGAAIDAALAVTRGVDGVAREVAGAQSAAGAGRASGRPSGRSPVVIDLCTGSGAIAISVASEVPGADVTAVERDPAAARLARDNAERLAPGRVRVVQGDATAPATLAELDGTVDVVVSNPPYVPADALEDPETERFDPPLALFGGGEAGLTVPRAVIARAASLLRPGGILVMEHDAGQGEALRQAAEAAGLHEVSTGRDLAGRDRFLRAVR